MITFSTRILKFGNKGEKTGWRYIEISKAQAEKLNPGCRVAFRVKGKLDHHPIEKTALIPMGEGNFILPMNAELRKATGKKEGDTIKVQMQFDKRELTLSADFLGCLKDEPVAYDFFKTLSKSHQNYFSKWIESAKTENTKVKRITMAVVALGCKQGFPEMLRANKARS
ncbi:MAG TPA: YdeI/OmpD-associated family protein [Cyclobacteriaceae bacterium]|nr:YdeI/OmpD-associated family protein [Cyclobacteriaceae bacterium]